MKKKFAKMQSNETSMINKTQEEGRLFGHLCTSVFSLQTSRACLSQLEVYTTPPLGYWFAHLLGIRLLGPGYWSFLWAGQPICTRAEWNRTVFH